MPLLLTNLLAVLLLSLSPWFVVKREFGGSAVWASPFGLIDPQSLGLPPSPLPDIAQSLGWMQPALAVWIGIALAASLVLLIPRPGWRSQLLYGLAGVGIVVFAAEVISFYHAIAVVNNAALAQGVAASRIPLKRSSLSLGSYAAGFYALSLLLWGRLQLPGGRAFLVRRRGVVVPLVAMGLAILLGAAVVWGLRPGLGSEGVELSWYAALATKIDLVTYTFELLFSPITSLPGLFQSLLLATPLMFTGLAVAFGFHAGLFNIGAPGQLTMGAIATMLVGVYVPGPRLLVLPLAIAAAALGGGLWGAIPGWLKARFGTHEVINTIMMNYIASSVFLFLISSNQQTFFGYSIELPFKAPGLEARSFEIQESSRLPPLIQLVGLPETGSGTLSWGLPLAIGLGILALVLLRRTDPQRRLVAILGAVVGGYLLGSVLPGLSLELPPSLTAVRLNGAFLIAIFAVICTNYFLWRTRGGYELRAMGLSPKAAEYAGVNLAQKSVLAMAVAGALAGLAATHYVLGGGIDEYRLKQSLPVSVGFDGIAVALMGQNTPLGIALTSLLFGVLLTGGLQLSLELGISRELVSALQALIVLFIAAGGLLPDYFRDPLRAAQVEMEAMNGSDPVDAELVSATKDKL